MNDLNAFTGLVRRCVEDYDMIAPGDTVAVGVSGGKDSLVLLMALNELRRYYPKPFALEAITVELGFDGMDFTPVAELCETLGVPYTRLKTDIKEVVFDVRKEDNPCSLCAKMRRGALNDVLGEAMMRVQPPTDKGRRLKIYYMTQIGIKPPHFVCFCNDAKLFHFSYRRYLENQIRSVFGLEGTPIRMVIRQKGEQE